MFPASLSNTLQTHERDTAQCQEELFKSCKPLGWGSQQPYSTKMISSLQKQPQSQIFHSVKQGPMSLFQSHNATGATNSFLQQQQHLSRPLQINRFPTDPIPWICLYTDHTAFVHICDFSSIFSKFLTR